MRYILSFLFVIFIVPQIHYSAPLTPQQFIDQKALELKYDYQWAQNVILYTGSSLMVSSLFLDDYRSQYSTFSFGSVLMGIYILSLNLDPSHQLKSKSSDITPEALIKLAKENAIQFRLGSAMILSVINTVIDYGSENNNNIAKCIGIGLGALFYFVETPSERMYDDILNGQKERVSFQLLPSLYETKLAAVYRF